MNADAVAIDDVTDEMIAVFSSAVNHLVKSVNSKQISAAIGRHVSLVGFGFEKAFGIRYKGNMKSDGISVVGGIAMPG